MSPQPIVLEDIAERTESREIAMFMVDGMYRIGTGAERKPDWKIGRNSEDWNGIIQYNQLWTTSIQMQVHVSIFSAHPYTKAFNTWKISLHTCI